MAKLSEREADEVLALCDAKDAEVRALRSEVESLRQTIATLESVIGGTEAGAALVKQRARAAALAKKEAAERELIAIDAAPEIDVKTPGGK